MSERFELVSEYSPAGDQPAAIEKLAAGLEAGIRHQVLLGVTGSGKTFTTANVVARLNRPTLVISHNKTLAAQLYSEFKHFFPNNAVEYFVSYFDFYQPEAYIPRTDTFIEKDSSINEEIERLRLSTMNSLLTRRDVLVVASVSCIYGIGSREDYESMVIPLRVGQAVTRDQLLSRLVELQYTRNDYELSRGKFRARGDVVELHPAYTEDAVRIEFFGDEIERFTRFEPLTGETLEVMTALNVFPSKQFATPQEKINRAILAIREELTDRIAWFEKQGKLLLPFLGTLQKEETLGHDRLAGQAWLGQARPLLASPGVMLVAGSQRGHDRAGVSEYGFGHISSGGLCWRRDPSAACHHE